MVTGDGGCPAIADESIDVRITGKPTIKFDYGPKFAKFNLRISNRSTKAVSGFTGRYQFIQHGRTVELCGSVLNQTIPGGIEPGETRDIEFHSEIPDTMILPILDSHKWPDAEWKFNFGYIFTADGPMHSTSQDAVALIRVNEQPEDPEEIILEPENNPGK